MTIIPWKGPGYDLGRVVEPDYVGEDIEVDPKVADEIVALTRTVLYPAWQKERDRLEGFDIWLEGRQVVPPNANLTATVSRLYELSRTPWLALIVSSQAQTMYVDGVRRGGSDKNVKKLWEILLKNRFQLTQLALHRAALAYGYAYVLVTDGNGAVPVVKPVSPKDCYCLYSEPLDEWPAYAIRIQDQIMAGGRVIEYWDDEFVHSILIPERQAKPEDKLEWTYLGARFHNTGHIPFVRFTNCMDLQGRTPGEIEPFIPTAERIDKTVFDRLLIQEHNSFKIKWVSGMEDFASSPEEANRKKLNLSNETLLVLESVESRAGTFDDTDLTPMTAAEERDIATLSAVAQFPSNLLTGALVNLSPDALASARAQLTQKIKERQVSFGESYAQVLRLAAALSGDAKLASDYTIRVSWQNVEIRSISQAADAFTKIAAGLGVPPDMLLEFLPDMTPEWIEAARSRMTADDPMFEWFQKVGIYPPDAPPQLAPGATNQDAVLGKGGDPKKSKAMDSLHSNDQANGTTTNPN